MAETYIIAEAGVNHNGSIDIAKQLIEKAAEAGANAVKFQTFKADKLVAPNAVKAEYQIKTTGEMETQLQMLRKLQLSEEDHFVLIEHSKKFHIDFLSTPFDLDSLQFLHESCRVTKLKLPSGEITNAPLLLAAARTGLPIFLSTGMCTLGEVEEALEVLAFGYLQSTVSPNKKVFQEAYFSPSGQQLLKERITLLHCTTEYPCPYDEINLRVMNTLRSAFGIQVGYSDHSEGVEVSMAAAALGAAVIEKHFTLDCEMPGPDHKSSIEPDQLKIMVSAIRNIEKALGSSLKKPTLSELDNKSVVRKSIVAAVPIVAGSTFTETNLATKRPGTGISPMRYWELLGKNADKDYYENELIIR